MLGFIVGAVCAVAIGRMVRRRLWQARFGYGAYGYGCGPTGQGGGGPFAGRGAFGRGGRGGPGARWAMRSLFERLETTPGQERVIAAAFEELRENRASVRDELRQTRSDLAQAIGGGLIEDATLEEAYARQDRLLARMRVGFNEALKKVVEVLDESQRKELASWIERGFFRRGWSGPDASGDVWA
jgi:LTXXQ motif family protein